MRAEHFLYFNNGRIWGEDLVPVKCIWAPRWLGLLSVLGRWFCCCWLFVYCYSHCGGSVVVLCFVVRYFMSILVLQSSWWGRESWLLCLICLPGVSDGWEALPRGATGLSAVCYCGFSWSYSLTIFVCFRDSLLLVKSSTTIMGPFFLEPMLQFRKNVLFCEMFGNTRSNEMLAHYTENTGQGYWPIIGWFGFVPLFKDTGYIRSKKQQQQSWMAQYDPKMRNGFSES